MKEVVPPPSAPVLKAARPAPRQPSRTRGHSLEPRSRTPNPRGRGRIVHANSDAASRLAEMATRGHSPVPPQLYHAPAPPVREAPTANGIAPPGRATMAAPVSIRTTGSRNQGFLDFIQTILPKVENSYRQRVERSRSRNRSDRLATSGQKRKGTPSTTAATVGTQQIENTRKKHPVPKEFATTSAGGHRGGVTRGNHLGTKNIHRRSKLGRARQGKHRRPNSFTDGVTNRMGLTVQQIDEEGLGRREEVDSSEDSAMSEDENVHQNQSEDEARSEEELEVDYNYGFEDDEENSTVCVLNEQGASVKKADPLQQSPGGSGNSHIDEDKIANFANEASNRRRRDPRHGDKAARAKRGRRAERSMDEAKQTRVRRMESGSALFGGRSESRRARRSGHSSKKKKPPAGPYQHRSSHENMVTRGV